MAEVLARARCLESSFDNYNNDKSPTETRKDGTLLFIQTDQLGGMNMWGESVENTSQNTIQLFILLISVLCIPVMLIPKPWI